MKEINGGRSIQMIEHRVVFAESLEKAWEELKSDIRKKFPKKKLFERIKIVERK